MLFNNIYKGCTIIPRNEFGNKFLEARDGFGNYICSGETLDDIKFSINELIDDYE